MVEAEVGVTHLEGGGRGHEPRNAGGLWKLEEATGLILLWPSGFSLDFNSIRPILDFWPPEQ